MKMSKRIMCFGMLISCAHFTVIADEMSKTNEIHLPEYVGIYSISKEVRGEAIKFPTLELCVAYLSSVIASNAVDTNEIENFRKSSSIRLLGAIASTNSIGILVSNIDFVDVKNGNKPSVEALAAIGEPAVPNLLDVLKDHSTTPEKCQCAVKAMMLIKEANPKIAVWIEFMNEQKDNLPKEAWDRLWRYGSRL